MKKEIILASNSPRRIDLLKHMGVDFKVVSPNVEEEGNGEKRSPVEVVKKNAIMKVQKVAEDYRNAIIIGADTVVVIDGEIIGKPTNEKDARRILRKLRGRYHFVFSGVAVMETPEDKVLVSVVRSKVKMRDYSEEEIERYIATGEPMDKAGAYGIQGKGALLVEKIEGDYYNIVGLPLVRLNSLLNRLGYSLL
ncbi:Maf family protein [Dictyoglomus thermophilum]|uniref:dTTP/UTP pyrophosphatase n=2 Tax=Dictyoglomus thermophilum TaxID=14 RepID=NTPPA_DICT6|nr:Maf family protein [Dictyoglomus thermophilum]B5YF11.1 RecName: Full=dTTP/UTP pyrophosphatase; Short=dTTPase/UTPase; AltName: Full=Nucleoside triphosphate pyrophosphatase; AltName: Full=Nucleotide pyrophosphatase; Short=Nucleotide PPase [Dictyoglomus thermophilum H-6-12]ACI19577.1 septum formation protein Maf [Dictyoglomus thermophilum H-6-12]MCX7719963.1 Maf family protein [Dictyoglomus thermophilum]TYT22592.1 septum formation inhibitor Maf [Dictyoglomus thermophilum]